ncbi:ankyrin repeat-containing domain protein [Baffinella frigidus]|nr:ankyrin repeat-containing domain protein [Cryptophyta sp. CCMP2293]
MERAVALRQQVTCQLEEEEQRISWETEWRAHTKAEALQAKNSAQAEGRERLLALKVEKQLDDERKASFLRQQTTHQEKEAQRQWAADIKGQRRTQLEARLVTGRAQAAEREKVQWHLAAKREGRTRAEAAALQAIQATDSFQAGQRLAVQREEAREAKYMSLAEEGRSALHVAAAEGDIAKVQALLGVGLNNNSFIPNVKGWTRAFGDVDAPDQWGNTALHLAAWCGRDDVVRTLLKAGSAVDAQAKDGWTALHRAATQGHHPHIVVVRTLLAAGAAIHAREKFGCTALHLAAINGRDAVVRTLLVAGAAKDAPDEGGRTALALATSRGHDAVARTLREVPPRHPGLLSFNPAALPNRRICARAHRGGGNYS